MLSGQKKNEECGMRNVELFLPLRPASYSFFITASRSRTKGGPPYDKTLS